jgi:3-hydroxymyristoyl/3-hydroxydecanoyl-(acyl carrier protein) dehydratase
LRARARAWFVSRREAAARTLLTDAAGTVLFRLDLGYDVLSSGAMGRLVGTSPGSRDFEPVALDGVRDTGDRVTAEFTVTSGTCAGHYDDAPVLPICALTAAMGQLLPYARGEPGRRWTPGSVSIEAWTPVRAGSTVTVTAPRTGGDRIPCEASVDGAVVARGDLEVGAARAYGSAMS